MKLGDVCDSVSVTFDKTKQQVVLINTSDVLEGEVTNHILVDNKGLKGQFKKTFQKNDILYSEIRPKNRRFAYIDFDSDNYVASTKLMVIRANNRVLPQYLYQILKSEKVINQLQSLAESRSGTFPQITFSELAQIDVYIPELSEQKEIADFLKLFDDKIENNKKINHHLLEQARLLYKNLISSNDTKYQNLSDIARITMGQSPKGETYNYDKIGLPLLNGATDFRNSISPSKWTSDPRKIARPGEYVFGVRATIGLTTKIFKEYAIGRGTGSAKPISNIFDEYLFFALEDLFDYYANLGSGTVYINISKSDFDSFKVILPIKDQFLVDFHKTVQPLFNLIFNNNAEIQKLSELRDCLLPKLLSGEISINQATK